jgi:hypothetical protein
LKLQADIEAVMQPHQQLDMQIEGHSGSSSSHSGIGQQINNEATQRSTLHST